MVADGSVKLTDWLQDRLGRDITSPNRRQGNQTNRPRYPFLGLPREAAGKPGEVATSDRSKEDYVSSLKPYALLFAPGTGILYSNFGFDLLAQALANVAGKPYAELLQQRVLEPAGLKDTRFDLPEAYRQWAMQGHNFDGSPMPFIPTSPMIVGAGGLFSTVNDMLRWLS